ncbi:uncharacterized protein LOC111226446 isoform X1 [Seriola dumerili]|uniref:uncharacterized protein LOC111226446 isoform X1 n=1 Tax=Seriola dumerili TaxID=41447 RepID=UPI000BBECD3F|nr:uncharacterized protein LOC111226446 isoform X1 [Seriola dumerili]
MQMARKQTTDRCQQLVPEILERGDMFSTITKELRFPLPQIFFKTFITPHEIIQAPKVLLHFSFEFSKDYDVHHLSLCLSVATNGGETQIMEEDSQQEDAPFHLKNKIVCSNFIFKLSNFSRTDFISLNNINTKKTPPITDMQLERFHEHYRNQHVGKTNQHALAVIFLEGDEKTFYKPKPQFRSKGNSDNKFHVHTEQLLIQEIDEFLQPNKQSNGPRVECIVIYTYNSPCLKRETQNIDPCMYQMSVKACVWFSKYEIFTYVLFTQFWGPIGRNFLKDDECKSLLYLIAETHDITFKLDSKNMREKLKEIDLKPLLSIVEGKYRSKLWEESKKVEDNLIQQINEPCTIKEHLDRGEKVIASSTFHPKVQVKICKDLSNAWYEGVKNSVVEHLRAAITADCKTVTMKCFLENIESISGNRSPIKFYQIDL